jgi:hypothetical protein
MTEIEQAITLMRFFLNHCCFDRSGNSYCHRRQEND